MKVVEIVLRTPGIFLSVGGTYDKSNPPILTLELKSGSRDFTDVNDIEEIKIVSSTIDFSGSLVTGSLPTSSVDVPRQDEGIRRFNLLMPDSQSWDYRIVAKPCLDCKRIFESNSPERVLPDGGVIVGQGTIQS